MRIRSVLVLLLTALAPTPGSLANSPAAAGYDGSAGLAPASERQHPAVEHPLPAPLDPDDPRAHFDPQSSEAESATDPVILKSLSRPSASAEEGIAYDPATGVASEETLEGRRRDARPFTPGNLGPDAAVAPEVLPNGDEASKVFGNDDRLLVSNTTAWPWRTVCRLTISFPSGDKLPGTGVLIASKYVLTAGHCVYQKELGGWATSIQVIPGLDGSYKPYGLAWGTKWRAFKGWTKYGDSDHDMGLITLDRHIGNSTGWLGYGALGADGVWAYLSGYPKGLGQGMRQYWDSGEITFSPSQDPYGVYYTIDAELGQSGAGLFRIIDGKRYVFAVHIGAASGQMNVATLMTSAKYHTINDWVASGT
jgi:V8-like Glu-specific endopeptidase